MMDQKKIKAIERKAKITPSEAEMLLQNHRDKVGFGGEMEKELVDNSIENAKRYARVGNKVILSIPPHYIHVPEWQRDTDMTKVRNMSTHFDERLVGFPRVMKLNDELYGVDGVHRILAKLLSEGKYIDVELIENITEDEAMKIFAEQTDDQRRMSLADKYRVNIKRGVKEWLAFREICKANNVAICCDKGLVEDPVGLFTSISDGIKTKPETLDKILKLIVALQWNGGDMSNKNAFSAKVIRAVGNLYRYYRSDEKQFEEIMLRCCKGNDFYVRNLREVSKELIFDRLSEIVNGEFSGTTISIESLRKERRMA